MGSSAPQSPVTSPSHSTSWNIDIFLEIWGGIQDWVALPTRSSHSRAPRLAGDGGSGLKSVHRALKMSKTPLGSLTLVVGS